MFQYAAARRLAHHTGQKLKLDLRHLRRHGIRNFQLAHFQIPDDIEATNRELAVFALRDDLRKLAWCLSAGRVRLRPTVVTESGFRFDPKILQLQGSIRMEGYWQSPRYFSDIEEIIRREFRFRVPPDRVNTEIAARILSGNSISVHVRCGDYRNDPKTAAYHGYCSTEYYNEAIDMMSEYAPMAHYYIFSDDPEWARNNLKLGVPHTYISHNNVKQGYEDMRLMSQCKHHIIANSSFSWWGAWLNANPQRKVIAPKQWFNVPGHDTSDLMPSEWIRL